MIPSCCYQDILVGLAPDRGINNGEPSLHARCIAAASTTMGDIVIHVGADGYNTAILAHLAGPSGHVHAYEIEADIAARAAANLAHQRNVTVLPETALQPQLPVADVIYVNAGATHVPAPLLDALGDWGSAGLAAHAERAAGLHAPSHACVGSGACRCDFLHCGLHTLRRRSRRRDSLAQSLTLSTVDRPTRCVPCAAAARLTKLRGVSETAGGCHRRAHKMTLMTHHHHRIDYIEFSATDIPATKAFYSAVFGWTFTDYGPDYTSFEDGQMGGGFARVRRATGGPLVILYSSALEKTQAVVTEKADGYRNRSSPFPGAGDSTFSIRTATSWPSGRINRIAGIDYPWRYGRSNKAIGTPGSACDMRCGHRRRENTRGRSTATSPGTIQRTSGSPLGLR